MKKNWYTLQKILAMEAGGINIDLMSKFEQAQQLPLRSNRNSMEVFRERKAR
jgi:hypothetical protein